MSKKKQKLRKCPPSPLNTIQAVVVHPKKKGDMRGVSSSIFSDFDMLELKLENQFSLCFTNREFKPIVQRKLEFREMSQLQYDEYS